MRQGGARGCNGAGIPDKRQPLLLRMPLKVARKDSGFVAFSLRITTAITRDRPAITRDASSHGVDPPSHGMDPPSQGIDPPSHGMDPPSHGMEPPSHGMDPPSHESARGSNGSNGT